MGQLVRQAPSPRGLRRPFGRCLPVAPFCEVKNQGSHPDRWPPPSLDSAPRGASRPFLGHSAKMPRIRFYNRRFASRAPATNTTFGDCPPSAVGNPPAFDFETDPGDATFPPFRPRTAPDHLAVIRPPTAACLTARRRLRVDRLPTSALARFGRGGKSAAAFSTACDSAGFEPSDTSHERPERGRVSALDPITRAPFRPGTSMRRPSRSPRCLPPKKTTPEALASTGWSAAAAGRRWQTPHVFIDVRRTSTRPLFDRSSRTPSRPHALPRLLQMNVSASTTVDHWNIPNRRGRPLGRLPR
jgi:hypothetical protein